MWKSRKQKVGLTSKESETKRHRKDSFWYTCSRKGVAKEVDNDDSFVNKSLGGKLALF